MMMMMMMIDDGIVKVGESHLTKILDCSSLVCKQAMRTRKVFEINLALIELSS